MVIQSTDTTVSYNCKNKMVVDKCGLIKPVLYKTADKN